MHASRLLQRTPCLPRPPAAAHTRVINLRTHTARSMSAPETTALSSSETMALVKELEQSAAARHLEAQQLNKEQRFEEAQAKYAEMRALDAEALRLTQTLGCPGCVLPEDPTATTTGDTSDPSSSGRYQPSPPVYTTLHTPRPWPAPAVEPRAASAIRASAVADAAATGVQWIYDLDTLQRLVQERQQAAGSTSAPVGLEFMDPPRSPFLPQYAVGRPSPYGEETWALLTSLAAQEGLSCQGYAATYAQLLGEGFDGYRNASTTGFLRNYARQVQLPQTGADDKQADCVARLAPLVAMFAGDLRLMHLVEAVTRTTQNTSEAVAWAAAGAAVLERLMMGDGATAAVAATVQELQGGGIIAGRMPVGEMGPQLAGHLQQVLDLQQQPTEDVINLLGRNCHMPNACQTPLHIVIHQDWLLNQQQQQPLTEEEKQAVFMAGIRDALAGGGCCASRAGFAGALLGALLGPGCIPDAWSRRCSIWLEVQAAVDKVCAARGRQ